MGLKKSDKTGTGRGVATGGLVTSLTQADGTPAVPSGGTRLRAGQTMQFECRAAVDDDVEGYIAELSGDDGAKCV